MASTLERLDTAVESDALEEEAEVKVDDRRFDHHQNFFRLHSEAELNEMRQKVSEDGKLLVVDIYAPWCRACKRLLSQMHKTAEEERFNDVYFASIDFENCRGLCQANNVKKLPTLEIYNGDALRQRWAGASHQRLVERLEEAIKEARAGTSGGSSEAASGEGVEA